MTPEQLTALAREDIAVFAALVCRTDRGAPLEAHCDFHRELVEVLQAVEGGRRPRQLFICPPGHGKSTWSSIVFPAWYLGRHPERRVLLVSHAAGIASGWSMAVRQLMTSPTYQAVFPGVVPAVDKDWRQAQWSIVGAAGADPSFAAIGIGSATTGRRADLLIADDVVDFENSRTEAARGKLSAAFHQQLLSRLTDDGAALVIGHRWYVHDLYDELEREGWPVMLRPALAGDAAAPVALWPEVWSVEKLEAKRREVGPKVFEATYQGAPAALSQGGIFRREWFRYFNATTAPRFRRIIQYYDLACEAKTHNDYSARVTLGLAADGIYVLEVWRARLEAPELEREMAAAHLVWKPAAIFFEDATGSKQLRQLLQRRTNLPLRAAPLHRDKVSAAEAAAVLAGNGRIHLRAGAPWLPALLEELELFPHGAHDDQVDALTGGVNELRFAEPRPAAARRGDPLATGRWDGDEAELPPVDPALGDPYAAAPAAVAAAW